MMQNDIIGTWQLQYSRDWSMITGNRPERKSLFSTDLFKIASDKGWMRIETVGW